MSTLSLRVPESIHRELRALADREGVSINHLITSAVGEKLASLKTVEYLRARGARGRRTDFLKVLAKADDRLPEATDRIAVGRRGTGLAATVKRRKR